MGTNWIYKCGIGINLEYIKKISIAWVEELEGYCLCFYDCDDVEDIFEDIIYETPSEAQDAIIILINNMNK